MSQEEKTIGDIVEACQEQQPVTEQELRLALLCFYSASVLNNSPGRNPEGFEQHFRLMKSKPSVYLGARWTPGTVENTEGRALSKSILRAVTSKKEKS